VIERYLSEVVWTSDGMIYPELNCWGLVRHARHELYGLPLLPAYGLDARDKAAQTRAAHDVIAGHLVDAPPAPGAVAAAWRGRLCVHVAVVVEIEGRLAALEVDDRGGCRWRWLRDWVRRQARVSFYRDRDLSEPPAR
jgi:hypothetical protein